MAKALMAVQRVIGRTGSPERLCRGNTYDVSRFAVFLEIHDAVFQGKKRVIASDADVHSGREARPALAHDDAPRGHQFTSEAFYSETLRIAVASVAGTSSTFLMCHTTIAP